MYDRARVVQYADIYWNSFNPSFVFFPQNDCANFVSQCMRAGGMEMTFTNREGSGWWYRGDGTEKDRWSTSWTVTNAQYRYLLSYSKEKPLARLVNTAQELELGDVIMFDWKGVGRWNHNSIVTGFDANGPLVNAHTVNSYRRPWPYHDSYAWTPKTKYGFLHIVNTSPHIPKPPPAKKKDDQEYQEYQEY